MQCRSERDDRKGEKANGETQGKLKKGKKKRNVKWSRNEPSHLRLINLIDANCKPFVRKTVDDPREMRRLVAIILLVYFTSLCIYLCILLALPFLSFFIIFIIIFVCIIVVAISINIITIDNIIPTTRTNITSIFFVWYVTSTQSKI